MKKKPAGRKYRNLFARRGVIYYERVADGERRKISAKTADWNEAATFRDLYEQRRAQEKTPARNGTAPKFADLAERYLREATAHLAGTTREDRAGQLEKRGFR